MATKGPGRAKQGRLEDCFDQIIRSFCSSDEFFKFARSKDGLVLDEHDLNHIRENRSDTIERQKIKALLLWKQSQGDNATPEQLIKAKDNYLGQVESDATGLNVEESPRKGSVPTEPRTEFVQQSVDEEGKASVSVTNILAPINGPLVLGAASVKLAANGSQKAGSIDSDVPQPQLAKEILSSGCLAKFGGCALNFPKLSVKEDTKAKFCYKAYPDDPPDGFFFASSILSCNPAFHGMKPISICLPTFCSTEDSVAFSLRCKSQEGVWEEIDGAPLNEEHFIQTSLRSVDNLAVFIPTDRMSDVKYAISCFLFNNADGKFAMGFCLNDEAIKMAFCSRLKKEHFVPNMEIKDILYTSLGDDIKCYITPGQSMTNTGFTFDENFITGFRGHVSYCTLDQDAASPRYIVTQRRNGHIVVKNDHKIRHRDETPDESSVKENLRKIAPSMEFLAGFEASSMIGDVENAEIDSRVIEGDGAHSDRSPPFWQKDKITVDGLEARPDMQAQDFFDKAKGDVKGGGKRPRANIVFHGKVKAGQFISGAKNVKIDARRIKGQRPEVEPKVETLVHARQEDSANDSQTGKEVSPSIREPAQVEDKAKPTTMDCEKTDDANNTREEPERQTQNVEKVPSTIREPAQVQDKAVPISMDCEKPTKKENAGNEAGSQDQSSEASDMTSEVKDRHAEQPEPVDKAEPTYSESDDDDMSDQSESQEEPKGEYKEKVKEVDLKKEKMRKRKRSEKEDPVPKIEVKVQPTQQHTGSAPQFDTFHWLLMAIVMILVLYIFLLM